MEYNGDLVRHSLLSYCYEVGTKFHDCGKTKYTYRRRGAPPRDVFSHLGSIYMITPGLYFVPSSSKFVPQSSNFVPIIANRMTDKVPHDFPYQTVHPRELAARINICFGNISLPPPKKKELKAFWSTAGRIYYPTETLYSKLKTIW